MGIDVIYSIGQLGQDSRDVLCVIGTVGKTRRGSGGKAGRKGEGDKCRVGRRRSRASREGGSLSVIHKRLVVHKAPFRINRGASSRLESKGQSGSQESPRGKTHQSGYTESIAFLFFSKPHTTRLILLPLRPLNPPPLLHNSHTTRNLRDPLQKPRNKDHPHHIPKFNADDPVRLLRDVVRLGVEREVDAEGDHGQERGEEDDHPGDGGEVARHVAPHARGGVDVGWVLCSVVVDGGEDGEDEGEECQSSGYKNTALG